MYACANRLLSTNAFQYFVRVLSTLFACTHENYLLAFFFLFFFYSVVVVIITDIVVVAIAFECFCVY